MLKPLLHIEENGLKLVVANITEAAALFANTFFSEQEEQSFLNFKSDKRKQERAATLYVLHHVLGVKSALQHLANGKPYLADNSHHISVSHTQQHIGVAIHSSKKVGLDIEMTDRHFERIASRFLSEKEFVFCQTKLQQCIAWCAKEAIYKIADEEGVDFASQIILQNFDLKSEGNIAAHFRGRKNARNYTLSYRILDNCSIAYLVE